MFHATKLRDGACGREVADELVAKEEESTKGGRSRVIHLDQRTAVAAYARVLLDVRRLAIAAASNLPVTKLLVLLLLRHLPLTTTSTIC